MKIAVILFLLIAWRPDARSQVSMIELQTALSSQEQMNKMGIRATVKVQAFYSLNGYKTTWISQEAKSLHEELSELIRNAGRQGLNPCDYQEGLPSKEAFCGPVTAPYDTLALELRITDAAIRLFTDIANGNSKPGFSFDGLSYSPGAGYIPEVLLAAVSKRELTNLADSLNTSMPQVQILMQEISTYLNAIEGFYYKEEKIINTKVNSANRPLCKKLFVLGCTDSLLTIAPDSVVKKALKKAQQKFNLLNDGVLRSTTLAELNITISERLNRLYISINLYRWLHALNTIQPVIVANIPAAFLNVYYNGESILDMRLIVGKPSTPTPTLTSRVSEVILYPYWVVPSSIISNEILPKLRTNPGYINAGNYQILDKRGRILDPYKINWSTVSASNFPYIIRQSTGCDNALGLLKLNFYNPYTVYLHDTPGKTLFMTKKRYYSHGCMRMEKPTELGHLILGDNQVAIDTLEEKGCLKNQAPIYVPAENKLPVVVWYNPVGIDSQGQIVYFEDIYKKLKDAKTNSTYRTIKQPKK